MEALDLRLNQVQADERHKGGEDLEDDRAEIRQARDDRLADGEQRLRDRTRMRVEPEAVELHATRQMDLPDAIQWNLFKELVERLTPVQGVGEHVVHVEQKPAAGGFDNTRDKGTIRQLVRPGAEVIDSGLDGDGDRQRVLKALY